MKLTIIVDDSTVYVDSVSRVLDLTECNIPANVWALQWKDTTGWLEFQDNEDGSKPQNQSITELPAWANSCVVLFNIPPVPVEE